MLQPNAATYCIAQIRDVIHKKSTRKTDFLKQCEMQTTQQKIKIKIKRTKGDWIVLGLNSYQSL